MIALVTSQGGFPGRHAINRNCLEPQAGGVAPRLGCHTNEPGPAGRASCALRVLRLFCGSRDDGGGHVRGALAGRGPGTSPAQRTRGRRRGTLACPPWGASPRPPRPPPSWPAPPLLTCRCVGSQLKRGEIHSCISSPDCSRMPICTHQLSRVGGETAETPFQALIAQALLSHVNISTMCGQTSATGSVRERQGPSRLYESTWSHISDNTETCSWLSNLVTYVQICHSNADSGKRNENSCCVCLVPR